MNGSLSAGADASGLAAIAKALPVTQAVALMRYGVVDPHATELRAIWGMTSPAAMAALSLAVLAAYAAALTLLSIRVLVPRQQPPPSARRTK